jgi:hypothetical protein
MGPKVFIAATKLGALPALTKVMNKLRSVLARVSSCVLLLSINPNHARYAAAIEPAVM